VEDAKVVRDLALRLAPSGLVLQSVLLLMLNDLLLALLPLLHVGDAVGTALEAEAESVGAQVLRLRSCIFPSVRTRIAAALCCSDASAATSAGGPVLVSLEHERLVLERLLGLARANGTLRALSQDAGWVLLAGMQSSLLGQLLSGFEQCSSSSSSGSGSGQEGTDTAGLSSAWEVRLRVSPGIAPLLLRRSCLEAAGAGAELSDGEREAEGEGELGAFLLSLPLSDAPLARQGTPDDERCRFVAFASLALGQAGRLCAEVEAAGLDPQADLSSLLLQFFHGAGVVAGLCLRLGLACVPLSLPVPALDALCGDLGNAHARPALLLLHSLGAAVRQGLTAVFPAKALALWTPHDMRRIFGERTSILSGEGSDV
jgi:hypothetical protein